MKIISQGANPALVPIQATCGKCRSVIEFLPHEAKLTFSQHDGDFYTIVCPVCQNPITKDVRGASYAGPG